MGAQDSCGNEVGKQLDIIQKQDGEVEPVLKNKDNVLDESKNTNSQNQEKNQESAEVEVQDDGSNNSDEEGEGDDSNHSSEEDHGASKDEGKKPALSSYVPHWSYLTTTGISVALGLMRGTSNWEKAGNAVFAAGVFLPLVRNWDSWSWLLTNVATSVGTTIYTDEQNTLPWKALPLYIAPWLVRDGYGYFFSPKAKENSETEAK